jgi:hypothetical protein
MEQRFAFDRIADVYKAARLNYPGALIEDVVSYAGLKQNDRILEVGCGTGQATKSFARQGFPIVAIDPVGLPASLLARLKEIYLRRTGQWGPPPEAWYLPNGPFKGWFDESGLFGPVEHRKYPWDWRHTTSSYADFLRTRSEHRMMESARREQMLGEIAKAVDDQGGEFTLDYETHLYIARYLGRD